MKHFIIPSDRLEEISEVGIFRKNTHKVRVFDTNSAGSSTSIVSENCKSP